MKTFVVVPILAALSAGFAPQVQAEEHPIPQLVQKNGRFALIVDGAPYLILGAQANNSSDWAPLHPSTSSARRRDHQ
jgi:hypothetical protein